MSGAARRRRDVRERRGGIGLRARVNSWAVLVAAVAAMIASAVYYTVLGDAYFSLRGIDPGSAEATPQLWELVGQLARNLVVALVLAYFLGRLQATRKDALRLGLLVWLGFQAMAVAGSVLHEDYPLGLDAIHVGDALLATLIMALVLASLRPGQRATR
jgi:Protein of unknown function (DUF1761)